MLASKTGKSLLSLDVQDSVKYTVLLLMKPNRLVVTLQGDGIRSNIDQLPSLKLPPESGISNIKVERPRAGVTRISFGLAYLPSTLESHVDAAPYGMQHLVVAWPQPGGAEASAVKGAPGPQAVNVAKAPVVLQPAPAAVAQATEHAAPAVAAAGAAPIRPAPASAVKAQAAGHADTAVQPAAAHPEGIPESTIKAGVAAVASEKSPDAGAPDLEAGQSAPPDNSDMMSIYRDAEIHDSTFAAARAAFEAAKEKAPQGFARLLPAVGLSANSSFNRNNIVYNPCVPSSGLPCGQENYNTNGYTFSFTQPIFQMQDFIQWGEDELQVAAAQSQFFAAKQELIMKCTQKYFDVLLAQSNLDLVRAQRRSARGQLEQAKLKLEIGAAMAADIEEAQAKLDTISSQEISAASDLEIKRRALEVLTGKEPGTLSMLGSNFTPLAPKPLDIEKWVEAAKTNNYQVLMQQALEEVAEREIDKNKAGNYPTMNLVASVGRNASGANAFTTSASEVTSNSLGVQFNMPLYQGGEVSSKVREAVANREKAREDLESARRSASLDARQSYFAVTDGMAQIKALEQALASSKSLLEATRGGAEIGVYSTVDVLSAEQRYYAARHELYQARYKYLISGLKLKAVTGSLNDADIEEINRAMH